jgi:nitroreductase
MTVSDPRTATDLDFPRDGPRGSQLRFMLNHAVLAPSVLNTQPWRFAVEGDEVRLYADRARQLHAVDPLGRNLALSCGAALLNLRLAAHHHGYRAPYELLPDPAAPDLLACLTLGPPGPASGDDQDLVGAIVRRHTERRPLAPTLIEADVLTSLQGEAEREGARLHVVQGAAEKAALAGLVADAIRAEGDDPEVRDELRGWLRADRDPRPDGVPDAEQDLEGRRYGARVPASAHAEATRRLAAEAPVLLVVTSRWDDPRGWLMAGQALERVLLRATLLGLSASFLNPAVEVDAVRERLAALVGGGCPQVVLRMGYPVPRGGTARRRVDDVSA